MPKQVVSTDKSPKAIGPYSQAIRAGQFLFISGQVPVDPATGEIVPGDTAAQADRVLKNIVNILEAVGATLRNVVKATVFMTDMKDFSAVNEMYARYFSTDPPARSAVQVSALPRGSRVEIEAIAWIED